MIVKLNNNSFGKTFVSIQKINLGGIVWEFMKEGRWPTVG